MQMAQITPSITQTQSVTLVKNLFRASFSAIAYVRDLFDDDCFAPGKIGGTKYQKIVKGRNKEVRQFVDWLELGVFDALQRKYLEVVLLEIYDNQNSCGGEEAAQKLIECFMFKVSYGTEGATFDMGTKPAGDTSAPLEPKAQIKQTTSDVLQALIELTGKLQPLPSSRIISMKLLYTPQTPQEYEPPLFGRANPEDMSWFEEKQTKITAGTVTTPFHRVSMTVHTSVGMNTPTNGDEPETRRNQRSGENIGAQKAQANVQPRLPPVVGSDDSTETPHQTPMVVKEPVEAQASEKNISKRNGKPVLVDKRKKAKILKTSRPMDKSASTSKVSDTSLPDSDGRKKVGKRRTSVKKVERPPIAQSPKTKRGSTAKRPRGKGDGESVWHGTKRTRKLSQVNGRIPQH